MIFISLNKNKRKSKKKKRNKKEKKTNNISIVIKIINKKLMKRKVKKTNIRNVTEKRNRHAKERDQDLNKREKENAIRHLNREIAILIDKY